MKLKRKHFFEFEDLNWFPFWIRKCMTNYIVTLHGLFGTSNIIADLISPLIKANNVNSILDLCSGSGGPMIKASNLLRENKDHSELQLTMSDLYPNTDLVQKYQSDEYQFINYREESLNVTNQFPTDCDMLTMICSFHHMKPNTAIDILQNVAISKKPFFSFELSDNSAPQLIAALIGLPLTFIMVWVVTLFMRPLTIQQVIFTYLIPIIPLFIAWDGTISNIRTYTQDDIRKLLAQIESKGYNWEIGTKKSKAGKMLYLIGQPH